MSQSQRTGRNCRSYKGVSLMGKAEQNPLMLAEDFEDFFESSISGFVIALPSGEILRANRHFSKWIGFSPKQLIGKKFSTLLTVGGKIYYETHLAPLLRMQRHFDEIALELECQDGSRLHVIVSGHESCDENEKPQFIRFAVNKATDRRIYEQTLKNAAKIAEGQLSDERKEALLREQFVAVLGHDLRNPLGAIMNVSEILSQLLTNAGEREQSMINVMKSSAKRMEELINNVMDFARARLGGGIAVTKRPTLMEPFFNQVIEELKSVSAGRIINVEYSLDTPVNCDPERMAQLFSNLLANALTHGDPAQPIRVKAFYNKSNFELSVLNGGKAIPLEALTKLFEPFTREEVRPSQHGLGLGLYIAAEIARAHGAQLTATSSDIETHFLFSMKDTGHHYSRHRI